MNSIFKEYKFKKKRKETALVNSKISFELTIFESNFIYTRSIKFYDY